MEQVEALGMYTGGLDGAQDRIAENQVPGLGYLLPGFD